MLGAAQEIVAPASVVATLIIRGAPGGVGTGLGEGLGDGDGDGDGDGEGLGDGDGEGLGDGDGDGGASKDATSGEGGTIGFGGTSKAGEMMGTPVVTTDGVKAADGFDGALTRARGNVRERSMPCASITHVNSTPFGNPCMTIWFPSRVFGAGTVAADVKAC